jgi:hypothetical protein
MFFRFVAGLVLVVLISMISILLEKQTLEMKRAVTRQYFQKDILLELHARHRLEIQRLTAPASVPQAVVAQSDAVKSNQWRMPTDAESKPKVPTQPNQPPVPRLPLMRWEHPAGSGLSP